MAREDRAAEPTMKELALLKVLKMVRAKSWKQSGITAELVNQWEEEMVKQIYELVKAVWREENLPDHWNESIIILPNSEMGLNALLNLLDI